MVRWVLKGRIVRWMDGQMVRWSDGRMGESVDGRMGEYYWCVYVCVCVYGCLLVTHTSLILGRAPHTHVVVVVDVVVVVWGRWMRMRVLV